MGDSHVKKSSSDLIARHYLTCVPSFPPPKRYYLAIVIVEGPDVSFGVWGLLLCFGIKGCLVLRIMSSCRPCGLAARKPSSSSSGRKSKEEEEEEDDDDDDDDDDDEDEDESETW